MYLIVAIISVIFYVVEMTLGYEHSLASPPVFIWVERVCASIMTFEIFQRWRKSEYKQPVFGTPLMVIDIVSILPFFLGFFVPVSMLSFIRSFRVLRLFKALRYSRGLQLVYLSFYRARFQLVPLLKAWVIVAFFTTIVLYQTERKAQEEFDSLLNSAYFTFVTATTIGYGDMSPVTPTGRVVTILVSGINLMLFAGLVGIVGSSISTVMKEEEDTSIDPLTDIKTKKINENV